MPPLPSSPIRSRSGGRAELIPTLIPTLISTLSLCALQAPRPGHGVGVPRASRAPPCNPSQLLLLPVRSGLLPSPAALLPASTLILLPTWPILPVCTLVVIPSRLHLSRPAALLPAATLELLLSRLRLPASTLVCLPMLAAARLSLRPDPSDPFNETPSPA